ncbi:MAG TPA: aldehyde dehydrogenase family protein, partial [Thermomonas sp.]|nr:aldehyde dehydrogenase family protein [Thermomonas sp.]
MTKTTAKGGRAAAAPGTVIDYAPSIESDKIVTIAPRHELYIGGRWTAPAEGRYFASVNPATLKPLSQIAEAGSADVDTAVRAAKRAYDRTWSKLSGRERGRYLFRIARLIQERARELAVLETLDNGKPIRETRDFDIPLVAAHFFYYAGWADKLGYALPGATLAPLGVAGQIIPWNFPLLMAAWKIAPA